MDSASGAVVRVLAKVAGYLPGAAGVTWATGWNFQALLR